VNRRLVETAGLECAPSEYAGTVPTEPHSAFGQDAFGRAAERAARFFGTPQYIIGQSIVVVIWILLNAVALVRHWDPYPFILLNLAFSTQAAYAAPLILLAQTRQAERDKLTSERLEHHHDTMAASAARREAALERISKQLQEALDENTQLTRKIHMLLERSS
jgi:uncharacterized membrane protein